MRKLAYAFKADVDLSLWARPNPKRRAVHGNLGHPAQLKITDAGARVRGFDLAGTAVGSCPVKLKGKGN